MLQSGVHFLATLQPRTCQAIRNSASSETHFTKHKLRRALGGNIPDASEPSAAERAASTSLKNSKSSTVKECAN